MHHIGHMLHDLGENPAVEIAEFEALPYWQDAVKLRRYDEGAKIKALLPPNIAHFMPYVAQSTVA